MNKPKLIPGGIAIDDRGQLIYHNYPLEDVKRCYIVANHASHFVRAWYGHQKEAKYVTVLKGSALVGIVKIDDWEYPTRHLKVKKYILSAEKPTILYIPSGYANGFMNLTKDTLIMFMSTSTLEESKGDYYRFSFDHWNIWNIEQR